NRSQAMTVPSPPTRNAANGGISQVVTRKWNALALARLLGSRRLPAEGYRQIEPAADPKTMLMQRTNR
ncbi:MAG TPA: hypothetical protein P5307_10145, partial [Pirellulaceae bacterium]|nr:hypothetical protein [Pirellulaceae bacterium]